MNNRRCKIFFRSLILFQCARIYIQRVTTTAVRGMDFTQPTQTQPTQQAPQTQLGDRLNGDTNLICRLICTTGQYSYFDLTKTKDDRTWTVGRNGTCDFVLSTSTRLSNKHFKIWFNDGDKTTWIQDTSTNGTHLNNSRLVKGSNYMLNQGDEIAVGVGVPKDVVRFVVLFTDEFNPAKVAGSSADNSELGIHSDFIIRQEAIGQGAFATVKKAIERSTGDSYAVKIINRRKALNAGGAMVGVDRELQILRKLHHPNIVALKSFYEDMDNYYLVMELVPGGDLMDFVAANGAIGEDATQVITKQILEGISYVHKLGILHRDLKPDNILIMQDDPILVKITDFGLAKISDNATFMKTFCGTLAYVAPEVITGKFDSSQDSSRANYSSLVDIWSLGCLVYVLLTSHLPFNGKTQAQMFQKIKQGEFHESPLNSYNVSPEGRDFLRACLQVDPRQRMTAEQALKHNWLSGLDSFTEELQKVLSLSQSQSQQSRKVDNGIPITDPISKIDEELMLRPLDSERNKKKNNEFKVPKRVVPMPQSQQPKFSQDSQKNGPSPVKRTRSEEEDSLSLKKQKSTDPNGAKKEVPQTTKSHTRGDIPKDTFIHLKPLKNSIAHAPIFIRQGVNPYAVGRNETCDTFINDDRMSKIHCLFNKKRHPVFEKSIYESPAHCLDDVWLLDFSTNSCLVNGVVLGKGKKVQLFNGDHIAFFQDGTTHEVLGFEVDIHDPTGLFNGGERLPENDPKFVNVMKQDASDMKLRPKVVLELVVAERGMTANPVKISYGTGGSLNLVLRHQRKRVDEETKAPGGSQVLKRASLQIGQQRPTNSWIG